MKVGIIGYGTRINSLMDTFCKHDPGFRIAAVTDTCPERVKVLMDPSDFSGDVIRKVDLEKVDANWRSVPIDISAIHFYEDADAMLDSEKLDGVLVGTNCSTHAFFARKVLQRDLPLYLEKPVATSMVDLADLENAYRTSKSEVVVSFPLRVTRLVQEVKAIIDSGEIGRVEHVQAFNDVSYGYVYFHDWYRDETLSNGLFLQKATHDFDVINYLVNEEPVEICAMKSKQIFKGDKPAGLRCKRLCNRKECTESSFYIKNIRHDSPRNDYCCYAVDTGNEDSGSAIIRYASGMHVSYSQNFFARKAAGRRGARLYGYKGTVGIEYHADQIKVYDHLSDKTKTIELHTPAEGHGGGDDVLVGNYIQVMQGSQKSISPLGAGILSARMCLLAKLSAEEHRFVKI